MKQTNVILRGDGFEMSAGRVGNGKNNYVILPGLSTTEVSPFAGALADRYGEDFLKDRSLWLVDRRKEIPEGYTIEQTAEDTVRALESAGVKEFDLFGASMGAMAAVYIAALYPERVKRLVIVSTEGKIKPEEWPVFENWRRLAEEKKSAELTWAFYENVYGEATVKQLRKTGLPADLAYSDRELENFIRSIDSLHSLNAFAQCEKIVCPVYVFGSEGDRVFGTEGVRRLAALTGGELKIYGPEYGHAVYDEAPDFIEAVKESVNRDVPS